MHQLVVGQQHQAARLDRQLLGQRLDIGPDIRPTSPTVERSMYFGGFIRQPPQERSSRRARSHDPYGDSALVGVPRRGLSRHLRFPE